MTIIADRITQLVLEGKTLEQVKAAGVSLDFDGVYGATSGAWTTDMFVEAVYREIKANTRAVEGAPAAQRARGGAARSWPPATRPPPARKVAAAAKSAKKASDDPLEGKWVLNLFASNYEPSSLLPYRREMVITMNGDETTHAISSWRRPQGNGSPLSTLQLHGQVRRQAVPDSQLGQGERHAEARRREHDRADARRRRRRQGDVDVDAVSRSKDADGGREGNRRDGRRVHQHAGLREAVAHESLAANSLSHPSAGRRQDARNQRHAVRNNDSDRAVLAAEWTERSTPIPVRRSGISEYRAECILSYPMPLRFSPRNIRCCIAFQNRTQAHRASKRSGRD